MKKTTTITMEEEALEILKKEGEKQHRSVSGQINFLVDEWIKKEGLKDDTNKE